MDNNLTRESLVEFLTLQVNEFELLMSMYPNDVTLTDSKAIKEINEFIDSKSEYTPNHLDFVLNLVVNNLKLEVCVNLPSFYPQEEPDIYVRCNQLNRQQESKLNTGLSEFIKQCSRDEVCVYSAISWLQENIDTFNYAVQEKNLEINIDEHDVEQKFLRQWIYSHHIYNKKKRDEIIKKARELNLTGFCLPGKPGIICIEGCEKDCKEWWKDIKAMNWKRIVIRKTEDFEATDQKQNQKFLKFDEIHFQNQSSRHSKHADMSGFSKFMEEKGLTKAFNEFFGLCNEQNM